MIIGILVDNIIRQKKLESALNDYKDVRVLSTNLGLFRTLRENPDIILLEVLSSTDETHTLNLLNQIRSNTNSKIIVTSDRVIKILFRLTNPIVDALVIYGQSWDISIRNIIQAIHNVSQNRNWIDPAITGSIIINTTNYEKIDDNEQTKPRVKCCEYRLTHILHLPNKPVKDK